ncbi:hypothetical protein MCOR27_011796 [Pyricularia oryzae]|nr:hypothetical protein MCOR27_011796 [Pyricularia oryzae]
MRGVGGHPGWFWLFLLEGLLTCLIAGIRAGVLPDKPVPGHSEQDQDQGVTFPIR